jgi:hypothetical protein
VISSTLIPAFESPSLASAKDRAGPAYELRFLLDEEQAYRVEAWARRHLAVDPHGDPALGGAYRTTSLYCDTPELDVYYRMPRYKHRKFRVRRYGTASWVFVERKSKWGDRVEKRRDAISEEDVPLLAHPMSLASWPGHWFHRRLLLRRLGPACRIVYQRTAYVGACAEGPLRLTLDRHVRGILTSEWNLTPFEGGLRLLADQVILELKFRSALPALLKRVVETHRLSPRTASKYRLCCEAWGATGPAREAVNA